MKVEKVFYHPERKNNSPVFSNYHLYQAVRYFLRAAEVIEPQFIKDLEEIIPLFNEAENLQKKGEIKGFIDNWETVQNTPQLSHLKEALLNWSKKYNLVDDDMNNILFLEIGLWTLPSKRDHPNRVKEFEAFCKKIDRSVPKHIYQWTIIDSTYFESEIDDIELGKNGSLFSFDKWFPFVFSPTYENLSQIKIIQSEDEAFDFEQILMCYEHDVNSAYNGEKDNVLGFYSGSGWDPRQDTWTEFEGMLDEAFKKYKKLYRKRTEDFMLKNGYIEGQEKRNIEHFQWLVRYQIQGWSIKEIADKYSSLDKIVSEDVVNKALHNTAKLVGLKLRKRK
jgi:hypothetical protein